MPTPTDFLAGTISLTNGSTAFTGVGTSFVASDIRNGDLIVFIEGGETWAPPIIAGVTSNTAGTLAEPWAGPNLTNVRYRIRQQWDSSRVSASTRNLVEQLGNGNITALSGLTGPGVPVFNGPHSMTIKPESEFINGVAYNVQVDTLADRAAYDGQASGFAILVSDVGDGRSAVYSKASNASGDWTDAAYVTGPVGASPVIEASIESLPSGSDPIVTVSPIAGGYSLDFELPGADGFYWQGNYDAGQSYNKDDVVRFNGSSFIALQSVAAGQAPSNASPPVDTVNWAVVAARGVNGTGTVTQIVAGTNISVDNSDPTAPVISSTSDVSFSQLQNFYATLAMEQAEDRLTGPVVAGPDGNGLFDGFNTTSFIDGSFSSGLDLSVVGEIRPSLSPTDRFTKTFNSNQTDYANFNHRFRIAASQISAGGDRIRLGLQGVTSGSSAFVSQAWVGHRAGSGSAYAFDGNQVQLTRGGNATFTIPVGMLVYTDWLSFNLDNTKDLIVSMHTTSGDLRCQSGVTTNFDWWTKTGANESNLNAPTGYTESGSYDIAVVASVQVGVTANMVARSSLLNLSSTPDEARIFAFLTLGGSVMNTDIVFDISRNDGANFTLIPMTLMYSRPGGSLVYASNPIALDGPSGSLGRWRLRTFNSPTVRILAVGIMFDD